MLLPSVESDDEVRLVAERIDEAIAEPFEIEGTRVPMSVAIGIAYFPDPHGTREELFVAADADMYRVKRAG
jgi:GGDEF domain-containing protein